MARFRVSCFHIVLIGVAGIVSACSRPSNPTEFASASVPPPLPIPATQAAEPAAPAEAPCTKPARDFRIDELVANLDNSDLTWWIMWWPDETEPQRLDINVKSDLSNITWGDVGWWLFKGSPRRDEVLRGLVEAMDDPRKIVAAHCELRRKNFYLDYGDGGLPGIPSGDSIELAKPPTEPFLINYHGLAVELTPKGVTGEGTATGGIFKIYECDARIEPAQFPSLRARWQKRLNTGD
jgi:hypothetical protein